MSIARRIATASTLRTTPLCMKSTPSTTPTGRAVRKLPETTRTIALAIGVFGRPCENAASISKRSWPAASWALSSATWIGDAHAVAVARGVALRAQLLVDLRPKAVHEDDLDAHRLQDRQVLRERGELAGGDQLAGDRDHEGLAVVGVDVRRDRAEPRHEGVGEDEVQGGQSEGLARDSVTRLAAAERADAEPSVPRVELARQPEDDLREDDAQHVAVACRQMNGTADLKIVAMLICGGATLFR